VLEERERAHADASSERESPTDETCPRLQWICSGIATSSAPVAIEAAPNCFRINKLWEHFEMAIAKIIKMVRSSCNSLKRDQETSAPFWLGRRCE
jgi:hypothetical protein